MGKGLVGCLALSIVVAGCQAVVPPNVVGGGTPAIVPGTAVQPLAPTDSASPMTSIAAQVVFPAGTWLKLRSGFGVKGLVNPEDISLDDLASLKIEVNGQLLTRDQFAFGNLTWGPNGELVATLNLNNLPPSDKATIGISNATGSVALQAIATSQTSANIQIDVNSTARALIVQTMEKKGITVRPEEVSERAVALVANQLTGVMTSQFAKPILGHSGVNSLLELVGNALVEAEPAQLSAELAEAEKTFGTTPSGGGGGSAGGGSTSSGGSSGSGSPATGVYVNTNAPFGFPEFHRMVKIGSRLWASMNGARLRYSDDFGQSWTEFAGDHRYGIELVADGTDLYGFPIQVQDQWQKVWKLNTLTNTVTDLDSTGLPTFINPRGAVYHSGKLYFGDSTTNKVYYKNVSSGIWYQFGTGTLGYLQDLETDGTNLYASTSNNGTYILPLASPGGAWTLLTGGATPVWTGDLLFNGTSLYTLYGDKLCAWNGSTWSQETVSAGLSGKSLWTDGTTLIASGSVSEAYTANGAYESRYVGYAHKRPLAGGAWAQMGDPFRWGWASTDVFQQTGDTLMGFRRLLNGGTAWDELYMDNSSFSSQGDIVSAGGYVWVLDENRIWRLPGTGGSWQQVETGLPGGWISSVGTNGRFVGVGNQLFLAFGKEVYALDASQASPTWALFGGGIVPDEIKKLATDGTDLFVLDDTGQLHQAPLAGGAWSVHGPVQAFGNARYMAAASGKVSIYDENDQKIYQLTGSGGTWSASPALTGLWVNGIVASNVRVMVAGSPSDGQAGIRQWDGSSWAPMSGVPVNGASGFATGSDGYYTYFGRYGLYKLPFGSTTWQFVDGYKHYAMNMTIEPASGNLFMLTIGAGVQQTL